ncbi:uncharacterized protein LOC124814463 isoform X2 [Hydra vulgaris]|uniref:Uncharacterized protein LOC124814463 isoform X2 n=1 Tax=Hydra vulgaris TaxID=6087 RepID=A0ABM4C090_HYDVU
MDPMNIFPEEVFEKILLFVTVKDQYSASQVSKQWQSFITENEYLWRNRCSVFENIISMKPNNMTWKETFQKNVRKDKVLKKWKQGNFRRIHKYEEQLTDFICNLNVDMWGYLLDLEESYNQYKENLKNLF